MCSLFWVLALPSTITTFDLWFAASWWSCEVGEGDIIFRSRSNESRLEKAVHHGNMAGVVESGGKCRTSKTTKQTRGRGRAGCFLFDKDNTQLRSDKRVLRPTALVPKDSNLALMPTRLRCHVNNIHFSSTSSCKLYLGFWSNPQPRNITLKGEVTLS
ncbi:hypothetical protein B0T25DRAFT_141165 [Lasiosphaeria hispida]|uniref:Secreted protein n=1 Tax=Lasiosphaeria hispida TaxID=260671 RepID=A0AAJ0MFP2_9PEZI|nr:hypothetical protein B0T25DRAFT_141165 [Lasiosphaeria hispida]